MRNQPYQEYDQEDNDSGWGTAAKLGAGAAALAAMTPLGKPLRKNIRQAWEWAEEPFGPQIRSVGTELAKIKDAVGGGLNRAAGGAFDIPAATWKASQDTRAGELAKALKKSGGEATDWGNSGANLTDTLHMLSGMANTGWEGLKALGPAARFNSSGRGFESGITGPLTPETGIPEGMSAWAKNRGDVKDLDGQQVSDLFKARQVELDKHFGGEGSFDKHVNDYFVNHPLGKRLSGDENKDVRGLIRDLLYNNAIEGPYKNAVDAHLAYERMLTNNLAKDAAKTGRGNRAKDPGAENLADGGAVKNAYEAVLSFLSKAPEAKKPSRYDGLLAELEKANKPGYQQKHFVDGGYA